MVDPNKSRLKNLEILKEQIRVAKLGLDAESKIPYEELEVKVNAEIRKELSNRTDSL